MFLNEFDLLHQNNKENHENTHLNKNQKRKEKTNVLMGKIAQISLEKVFIKFPYATKGIGDRYLNRKLVAPRVALG